MQVILTEDKVEQTVDSEMTCTFVVQLSEETVTAGIYMKHEEPFADEPKGVYDKIRTYLKEVFGSGGPSKAQWNILIESLLEE